MILIVLMAAVLAAPALTLEGEPAAVARAFERKAVVGAAAFAAEVDGVVGGLRARAEATGQCPSSGEAAAAAELELVRRTRDPQVWTRSRGEAEVALAERRRLRALYLAARLRRRLTGWSAAWRLAPRRNQIPGWPNSIDGWPRTNSRASTA